MRILTATMVLVGVLATTARAQTAPDAPLNVFPGKVATLKLQIPPAIMARYLRNKVIAPKRPMSTQPIVLSVPMEELTNIHPLGNKGLPESGCQCNPGELVIEQNPADKPPGATPNEKAAWQLVRAMGRVEVCQPKDPILNPADHLPAWIQTSNMMSAVDGVGGTACVKLSAVLKVLKIDTDSDGIFDGEDKCPTLPKGDHPDPKRIGCPDKDTDSDGIFDTQDLCPTVHAGPTPDPARLGCPAGDRDHDLIVDHLDACPDVAGVADPDPKKNGCPVPVLAAAPAPLVTPPAPAKITYKSYGYFRTIVALNLLYLAPLGLEDYSGRLSRGGGIGGLLGGEWDRIKMGRNGVRFDIAFDFHPYVYGQANVISTDSLTIDTRFLYMRLLGRNVNFTVGPEVLATHLVNDGARQLIAVLANLGVRYAPDKKTGFTFGFDLAIGGGQNTEHGYDTHNVVVVKAGGYVGISIPHLLQ